MTSAPHEVGPDDHVVQFYADAVELVESVGGYLVDAAHKDAVSVVIARAAHRDALVERLQAHGIDAAAAAREGTLVLLDAAETLARFMPARRIDPAAFFDVIGGVIRDAGAGGRPVRAFGEMVGLLWEAGDVASAIELETLWNELAREHPFSLYCAYRDDSVGGSEHAGPVHEVCRLHGAVVPRDGDIVAAEFADEPSATPRARGLVAQAMSGWGHDRRRVADAELVVTELAANAIVHARTPFRVLVQRCGPLVQIAVHDRAKALPAMLDPDPTGTSGRGMHLIDTISRRWGVEVSADGKSVWAELGH